METTTTSRGLRTFDSKESEISSKLSVFIVTNRKLDHKSANYEKVKSVSDRRKILSEKRLCFNWTSAKHRAADYQNETKGLIM